MTDDTHTTCSYYCDRPECVKAQRDALRDRFAKLEMEIFPAEIAELMNKLETMERSRDALQAIVSELRTGDNLRAIMADDTNALMEEIAHDKAQIRNLIAENDALRIEIDTDERNINDCMDRLHASDKEIASLKAERDALSAQLEHANELHQAASDAACQVAKERDAWRRLVVEHNARIQNTEWELDLVDRYSITIPPELEQP